MTSLHAATKTKFAAKRYMDDILLLMQKEGWDRQRFYEDFKRSECYARPLNLEEATDGTFLETFFTRNKQCTQYAFASYCLPPRNRDPPRRSRAGAGEGRQWQWTVWSKGCMKIASR